ncbi:DNA-packaging protein [Pseudogemmobacter faecipullorum]|uniref:DNA-packaging protein n=1 Tax=Pseudogemmobacter faecipullorum TaxID=2755041 RepID=A0ABS8CQY5_9RHOB|nr:DNA-packaging protein [Pseudogemmobacter faecipullorum]MCB5411792.1 DNA-packaging protein [Pseudogemmobacter faecipullorum]
MADRDPATGHFLPGNRIWEARASSGPKPKFETAEALWDAACEYFEWVHENPLYKDQLVTFQGSATHEPVAAMRAMTIRGLCLFLGVSHEAWRRWQVEDDEIHKPHLAEVMRQIEDTIYQWKFEGAAADLLNGSIIARDLGLADKKELTGAGGGPMEVMTLADFYAGQSTDT